MNLTDEQVGKFNSLFLKGTKSAQGLIILGSNRPSKVSLFDRYRIEKSIKIFLKCLEFVPNHWQSMFFLGKLYQRLGQHQNALDYFDKAIKIEESDYVIPQEASIEAGQLQLREEALKYSQEAIRRKPNDYALLGNYAMHLFEAKRYTEAIEIISEAISLNPDDEINLLIEKKIRSSPEIQ